MKKYFINEAKIDRASRQPRPHSTAAAAADMQRKSVDPFEIENFFTTNDSGEISCLKTETERKSF